MKQVKGSRGWIAAAFAILFTVGLIAVQTKAAIGELLNGRIPLGTALAVPVEEGARTARSLTDAEVSRMSSRQLAAYVFENHGCKTCHTPGKQGKFGLTDHGKEVSMSSLGCISLLTAMSTTSQEKTGNSTSAQNYKAASFAQFGCVRCHETTGGLTKYGALLKSRHMTCPDVERIMSQR